MVDELFALFTSITPGAAVLIGTLSAIAIIVLPPFLKGLLEEYTPAKHEDARHAD